MCFFVTVTPYEKVVLLSMLHHLPLGLVLSESEYSPYKIFAGSPKTGHTSPGFASHHRQSKSS